MTVAGEDIDTVRMPWITGKNLKQYIEDNLKDSSKLLNLADRFLSMVVDLRKHKISHGDLQDNNILVRDDGSIILIDYDSLCVPDIEGKKEFVSGTAGYQHPSRISGKDNRLTPAADYFSEVIIYLSLLAFAQKPALFAEQDVKNRDRELLFKTDDLTANTKSVPLLWLHLLGLNDYNITKLISVLDKYRSTAQYALLDDWLDNPLQVNIKHMFFPAKNIITPPKNTNFTDKFGIEMIAVEGGTFWMGAQNTYPNAPNYDADAYDGESSVHKVTLSDYYIGKYPVTQAQWKAVMGNNPSYFKGDNLPVEEVSWNDVQEFIHKLNQQTGKKYRLPTEAEWEFAARGGTKSNRYKYSGSKTAGNVAWYDDNSGGENHPVGTKSPNELGIYDMSGNVWEWCSDWYDDYSNASQTNPRGASTGSYRVLRGGGLADVAWGVRVSGRFSGEPGVRSSSIGFRLALSSN
jgi:formylglycine-generating enzyme required for sulfatase activity